MIIAYYVVKPNIVIVPLAVSLLLQNCKAIITLRRNTVDIVERLGTGERAL